MIPVRVLCTFLALGYVCERRLAADQAKPPRPNIVYLLADDLGWKDVGFQGSEIRTPILDGLAASGVKLNQFYVQPVCSPTRACLMTGRYCMRQGLQYVIRPWARYGLPLDERILPQALKEAGYRTVITGKWHLGFHDPRCRPLQRGFDHQYGFYSGMIDYFTHDRNGSLDWRRDDVPLREEGYSTQLIAREAVKTIEEHDTSKPLFLYVAFNAPHGPLQAPKDYLDRYSNIKNDKRRAFAAMVTCEDEMIGEIVAALDKRGMRGNTLILFSSDNGGPIENGASNGELRGQKAMLYEGGLRVPAFAVWPGKLKPGTMVSELVHVVDWYPTLLKLAGAKLAQPLPLDGRDIWPTIADGKPSPHQEILHHLEEGSGAIRCGDWKLITGSATHPARAAEAPGVELFNIAADPNEKNNLADAKPEQVKELKARMDSYRPGMVPSKARGLDTPPAGYKHPAILGD